MNIEIEKYINYLNSFDKDLNIITLVNFVKDLSVETFNKGVIFLVENSIPKEMAFITSGLVRSFIIDDNGNEKTINFFNEYNYIGDYDSMIHQTPTQYNFHFLERTTLVKIPFKTLKDNSPQIPKLEKHGRILAEEKLKSQNNRLRLFLTHSAEERYLYFIENYPEVFNRVSISHLCSYLGIERQTLTRIRKKIAQPKN